MKTTNEISTAPEWLKLLLTLKDMSENVVKEIELDTADTDTG